LVDVKRILANIAIGLFITVQALAVLAPPPAPLLMTQVFGYFRYFIDPTYFASPARYFSVSPISPVIAIYSLVDKDGTAKTYLLADRRQYPTNLVFQRMWGISSKIAGPEPTARTLANGFGVYYCRENPTTVRVIVEIAQRFSPTPREASTGRRSEQLAMLKSRRDLATVECDLARSAPREPASEKANPG
jgi:hypothetical protein